MEGYTKLFQSLIGSSIWQEDDHTRLVWITMLALKNRHHIVECSVPGLARLAGVPRQSVEKALDKFAGPDPDSRNKANEGRRIEECQGGWRVLNGQYYQDVMRNVERQEYLRKWKAEDRAKKNSPQMRERLETEEKV